MPKTQPITALDIKATRDALLLIFHERSVAVPWQKCSPKLAAANETERMQAELSPGGYGVHWPLLDEDLSVQGLLKSWESSQDQSRSPT